MITVCQAEDGQVSQVRSMLNYCTLSKGYGMHRSMRLYEILRGEPSTCSTRGSTNLSRFRIGSLELFLHQEIGIEEDAAIAYLSDGRRLTNGNIRDLGSAQDQVCVRSLAVFWELTRRRPSLYSTSSTSTMTSILFSKNFTMSHHYTPP
jgi:hypothetical protein